MAEPPAVASAEQTQSEPQRPEVSPLPPLPQVRYVPRHIGHHGGHSGYDRLFERMGLAPAASPTLRAVAQRLPQALAWRLWALRPQPTGAAGLVAELGALPWTATGRGRLCHFIYGEDTYFLTPLWQRGANRCIATFHYPPQRLAERVNPGSLRRLHAAVIVAEPQRGLLERFLPAERIHHCPHAVDTDFFSPEPAATTPDEKAGALRLVCVGSLFRDYVQLRAVHRAVVATHPSVETHVVGLNAEQRAQVAGEAGIVVHSGLSDDALRALYRSAAVGVLPLTDSTANNALLEMFACGLPVVTSNVGAVAEYAAGSAARLCPAGDVEALAAAVQALLDAPAQRAAAAVANRAHAEARFGMAVIARRMADIYTACLA